MYWSSVELPSFYPDGAVWQDASSNFYIDSFYWSQVTAKTPSIDGLYWADTAEDLSDIREWCSEILSNTASIRTFLGLTQTPEEFMVFPDDVTLEPEFVQEDEDQWYIQPGPS